MRSVTLARFSTIALLTCVATLAVSLLGFGAMVATNTAPRFSYALSLDDQTGLEIHNGSACPRSMPSSVCYWTGLAYRREFRIVYYGLRRQYFLVSIESPDR